MQGTKQSEDRIIGVKGNKVTFVNETGAIETIQLTPAGARKARDRIVKMVAFVLGFAITFAAGALYEYFK